MVHLSTPELSRDGDDFVVTARLSEISPAGTVRFRLPARHEPTAEAMADALFPMGLLLAMATDHELVLDAPVSSALLDQSATVQDIYASWYPKTFGHARLQVEARKTPDPPRSGRSMSTFTGGVDSFYTLQRNADSISTVLFVHGFDIPLSHTGLRATTSRHLAAAAASAGKELVEGATNLRRFLNPHLTWSTMSHGAAIVGFALLLSRSHGNLYLPASYAYADLFPWGSHPLVDRLWATEYFTVDHDGAGASRVAKTRAIAHDTAAQQHLRVCFQKKGEYNCERCKKCLRTKMALDLEGKLEEFATFTEPVDLDAVRSLGVRSESDLVFARENLAFAQERGRDDIAEVLSSTIDTYLSAKMADGAPDAAAEIASLRTELEVARARIRSLERPLRPLRKAATAVRVLSARS